MYPSIEFIWFTYRLMKDNRKDEEEGMDSVKERGMTMKCEYDEFNVVYCDHEGK